VKETKSTTPTMATGDKAWAFHFLCMLKEGKQNVPGVVFKPNEKSNIQLTNCGLFSQKKHIVPNTLSKITRDKQR
jgi:hypothetical protein